MRSAEDVYKICDDLIAEKGLTRADLCRKIGINPANYTMGVKRKSYFNVDVLYAISDELDISLDELLGTRFQISGDYSKDIKDIIRKLVTISPRDLKAVKLLVTYFNECAKNNV